MKITVFSADIAHDLQDNDLLYFTYAASPDSVSVIDKSSYEIYQKNIFSPTPDPSCTHIKFSQKLSFRKNYVFDLLVRAIGNNSSCVCDVSLLNIKTQFFIVDIIQSAIISEAISIDYLIFITKSPYINDLARFSRNCLFAQDLGFTPEDIERYIAARFRMAILLSFLGNISHTIAATYNKFRRNGLQEY